MNVFESDLWGAISLVARINELDYVPSRLAEFFDESGITTRQAYVEKKGDLLALVPSTPRGSPLPPVDKIKREAISFDSFRLAESTAVLADEVQDVRAFGSADAMSMQTVEVVRDERLLLLKRRIEATKEWHRVGAVRGLLREPDGSTLLDLFDKFDLTQTVVEMELDDSNTDVSTKALEILEAQEDALGAIPFTGTRAFCGRAFWRDLTKHESIRKFYLNQIAALQLAGDRRLAFEFGGIVWERYRGVVSGEAFIPDDEAYAIPEGALGLFIGRYAPADYQEAVNTMGLPFYAKSERMKFDRGIEIEAQSNPVMICTRPKSVIKLFRTTAPS